MIKVLYFDKKFNRERCFAYSNGLIHLAENMRKHLELGGIECKIEHTGDIPRKYDQLSREKLISSVPKLGIIKVNNSQLQTNAAGQDQNNKKQVVMVKDANGNAVPRKRGRPPKNQVIVQ